MRQIRKSFNFIKFVLFGIIIFPNLLCKKVVEIDQPVNSITTEGTFSNEATATAAVLGIYSTLINTEGTAYIGSGAITLYAGMSSDELSRIDISDQQMQFNQNQLLPDNSILFNWLWKPAYFGIYQTNSCIEGISESKTLAPAVKKQLIGECKFIRAFLNFYLVNLWGEVPLPLTSTWTQNYLLPRSSKSNVYQQIVSDLQEAEENLRENYTISNNQRVRPTKYAATALLARVYLYLDQWANAETAANDVINNNVLFNLEPNLNNVFLKTSKEAILQFEPSNKAWPWAVVEQNNIVDYQYYLTNEFLNSFDSNDQRKTSWTNSFSFSGTNYYRPFKYKIKEGSAPGGSIPEYYMVLRLAEQYLIRAEARAELNKVSEGLVDLNIIRSRAGLPDTVLNDKTSLVNAIIKERQVELFAEWGHRWFDLIRTNRTDAVLAPLKGSNWHANDTLYPIPLQEIISNPSLTQNQGY